MTIKMTIEEARNLLRNSKPNDNNAHSLMLNEALEMAIKSLDLVEYIEQRYQEECNERREKYADGWYHSISMCDGASYALGKVLDKWKESVGKAESEELNGEIQR